MQIRFLITPNQELSVSMGLDHADGDTVALWCAKWRAPRGTVSNFEAVRCELGCRYSFADAHTSGFFLAQSLGLNVINRFLCASRAA